MGVIAPWGSFEFNGETIALGHWDTDPRSDPFNLIPTKELAAAGITTVYTGHVHLPQQFIRDGVTVNVIGSMVPLAHGEDATGELYVTASLEEVLADPAADPAAVLVRDAFDPPPTWTSRASRCDRAGLGRDVARG